MADNVKLSAGTNDGATLRTFEESGGVEWPASVAAYATTVSPGANVLQPVQVGHGLPVAQDGTWVVNPGETTNTNPWNVSIKQGGNTAVVTAGGALTVTGDLAVGDINAVGSITDPVTVAQGTAGNLLCTASQGGSWTVAATQSGAWNVGTVATVSAVTGITNPVAVTQSGSWSVGVSGAVTVSQATASSLNATVSLASGQTLGAVTTVGTITNPVAATQSGTWNVGVTGTAAVTQSGTWNVGTVSTVSAVTSITNPVAVTQSGTWNVGISGTPAVSQSGAWTVGLSAAQTLANVTTVGTITNAVTVAQPTAGNLNCTASLAAGANLVGKASVGADTGAIYNGTTALTPKFAKISAGSSGDNQVVAPVSGKKIRVLRWGLTANGAVNAKWRSNTTDLTGLRYLTQYASAGGSFCPVGVFETAAGEALNLNLSAAVVVGGEITYVEV